MLDQMNLFEGNQLNLPIFKTPSRPALVKVNIGDYVTKKLDHSEVCMHMKIAGKTMRMQVISDKLVQLLNEDGSPFSAPILTSEAGFFTNSEGLYFNQF